MTRRKQTDFIVVHCSATKVSADIGAKEIKQWHIDKGWSDIGYHFVIRRNGTLETGRPIENVGAHVAGYNHNSIGICLVGGIDSKGHAQANFTNAQYSRLRELLKTLLSKYPTAIINGHRDFPGVSKDCPCFDVADWWALYRRP